MGYIQAKPITFIFVGANSGECLNGIHTVDLDSRLKLGHDSEIAPTEEASVKLNPKVKIDTYLVNQNSTNSCGTIAALRVDFSTLFTW